MTNRLAPGVILALATTLAATGCADGGNNSTWAKSSSTSSEVATSTASSRSQVATTATPTATTPSEAAPSTPTGPPIGTATMKVTGPGPATIRYQINGGPQQTESNVVLPWEKQYPVYKEIQTSVSADAGDAELICTIIMNGNLLVSFVTQPRPTCSFADYD